MRVLKPMINSKKKTCSLFNIPLKENLLLFFYYNDNDEKIEISNDNEFQNVIEFHLENNGGNVMKLTLETEILDLNVDKMINNLKISESFEGNNDNIIQKEENKNVNLSMNIDNNSFQEIKRPEDDFKNIDNCQEEPKINNEKKRNPQIIKDEENLQITNNKPKLQIISSPSITEKKIRQK